MAKYSLTVSSGDTYDFVKVTDLHYKAHSCVYSIAESNGILDRPGPWACLRLTYGFRPKAPAEITFGVANVSLTLRRLA